MNRAPIVGLGISGIALIGLLVAEGYRDNAYIPVAGDVPTIGFGTTQGVKMGDKITVPKALNRALSDVQKFEGGIKSCVKVPLHQYEYDAYTSLAYNIGSSAFCRSTLVRKLNAGDYTGACKQILRWNNFKGKPLRGLTIRREKEYKQCIGN
ncbi:MAG TPA: lysozyme [Psychromonas sp.]|nr:glycoside hydrolase family 24 [Shewanella frigidimarina]